jgi:hypothetical protein
VKCSLTGLDTGYAFTALSDEHGWILGHKIQGLRRGTALHTSPIVAPAIARRTKADPRVGFTIACTSFRAAESETSLA